MFTDKRLLAAGAFLLAGATILITLNAANDPEIEASSTPATDTSAPISAAPTVTQATPPQQPAATPMETQIDGALRQDEAGNLIIDLALRDYIDYFLNRIDVIGQQAALDVLMKDAQGRVGAPALQEFTDILDSYIAYKLALMSKLDQPLSEAQQIDPMTQLSLMRQINEQVMLLRRQYLGEIVTTAFFGTEDAYAQYTLRRMELANNRDISDATRAQAMQELEQLIPPAILANRQQFMQDQELSQKTTQLLDSDASESELRGKLAQDYDPEAVARLLAEHKAEQDLQKRYKAYRAEATTLEKAALDAAERQSQLAGLRQRLFSANEQLRVEILDASAAPETATN